MCTLLRYSTFTERVMSDNSKEADQFVKALSLYTPTDYTYYRVGAELSVTLDTRQHNRLMLLLRGYQEGM